jgi:hypothetical protein
MPALKIQSEERPMSRNSSAAGKWPRTRSRRTALRKRIILVSAFENAEKNTLDRRARQEALEKIIRELPRDASVIELFNKRAGADPLPVR